MTILRGIVTLSPIFVLLATYLIGALLAGDFYRVPISVAFIVSAIYGMILLKGHNLQERIGIFSRGAANPDIMYMIWIFCLAVIFASTSMAIGTSVGTIVALTPVVTTMAPQIGCSTAWLVAIVVGGAFFGDNLSFISDTTIAATQSQGCKMKDKFRTNFAIVLPAAIVTLCLYLFGNQATEYITTNSAIEWFKALPYLLVIVLALCGVNVLMVLIIGTISTAFIGLTSGSLAPLSIFISAGEGLNSMCELILVTLLAGGVMAIVKELGGFSFLIEQLTKNIRSRRTAEFVIATLTALTNFCTANNTIAILTVGPIARDLSAKYAIPARKSASLMDTASCIVQGYLPYGAQLLMAAGLAAISPVEIIPHLYYPFLIGCMVIVSIIFKFPRR